MSVQNDWFNIREIEQDIFLIQEASHVQCYLIRGSTHAALIDTGMGFCNIKTALEALIDKPVVVLNTHWHFDHIGGNALFQHIGIAKVERHLLVQPLTAARLLSLYITPCVAAKVPLPHGFQADKYSICSPPATFLLHDGQIFDLGGRIIKAIATPGHTQGSFSFWESKTHGVFCGDVLYQGTLYAHFVDSDFDQYIASLNKLLNFQDPIACYYCGHNSHILPATFIHPVLKAFQKVKAKTVSGTITKQWGEPAISYQFDQFALLTKHTNSSGIDLLESIKC
ncbi:MAG: MBL fold metallo-hydrolase [Desulfobacteraceae bacterium]|jgi:glyoxylase-like metal-dependent hydrolase (beta-lactamase superfamily II)